MADKAGDYRSAAVAIRGEGKRTRSNEAGTKVVAADLRVAIDGPQARYINRLADYTVRVTNHGEAAADDTRLTLHYPRELQMANVTQPRASNNGVSKTQTANAGSRQSRQKQNQQGQNQQAQPERAQPQQGQDQQAQNQQAQNQQAQNQQAQNQQAQNQQAQNQQAQNQQGQQQQDSRQGQANVLEPSETRTWQLGTLEPGETIELGFTVRGSRSGQAEFKAEAMYACQTAKDEEETTSVASARTQLIALPALMVAVVDNQDPVKVGEEFQYTIVVGNEGEAPDSNIEVKVELPGELQFVEASGDTKTESTGQTVQFAPVEELRPGQKARWTLTAKADQKGQIRLPVSVTSNQLSRATTSEEPTVLFASGERVTERPEETPAR